MNASSVNALQPVAADDLDTVEGGFCPPFMIGVAIGLVVFRPW